MAKPDTDVSVLSHIESLVAEEHRLFGRGELSAEEQKRLVEVQLQLDRCWDLLRQRRALREFGGDPAQAHARDADVVKKYIG
ncbi:MAG: DUF2630 family protein [Betaproteobacteria bacterium]|nr:MAG: DUF2630 family protein [Betaproteobacteria bacterium]